MFFNAIPNGNSLPEIENKLFFFYLNDILAAKELENNFFFFVNYVSCSMDTIVLNGFKIINNFFNIKDI